MRILFSDLYWVSGKRLLCHVNGWILGRAWGTLGSPRNRADHGLFIKPGFSLVFRTLSGMISDCLLISITSGFSQVFSCQPNWSSNQASSQLSEFLIRTSVHCDYLSSHMTSPHGVMSQLCLPLNLFAPLTCQSIMHQLLKESLVLGLKTGKLLIFLLLLLHLHCLFLGKRTFLLSPHGALTQDFVHYS